MMINHFPVTTLVSLLFLSFLIPRNVQEHFLFTSFLDLFVQEAISTVKEHQTSVHYHVPTAVESAATPKLLLQ